MKKSLLLLLIIFLGACQPAGVTNTAAPTQMPPPPSATPSPIPTQTSTSTTTPTNEPTSTPEPAFEVCSPLEEETLDSLPLILVNPLDIPPNFGQDTGHHGLDFAYYQRGDRMSIEGIQIYAIMDGRTVLPLVEDDIPYGYAILLETPLSDLPEPIQTELLANYLPVPEDPNYRLYCPEIHPPIVTDSFSVYHLYAHMEAKPPFTWDDPVTCGETLGTVGNSGFSSNPHLHLETRLGPSGASFTAMAHYENTNTPLQMGNYCLWRMSGYYQLFDPFILFDAVRSTP